MCKHGTCEIVNVKITADRSHTRKAYYRDMPIDKCIAPIVRALQEGGIDMNGSCCGHGRCAGNIFLADGRELVILESEESEMYRTRANMPDTDINEYIRGLTRDYEQWPAGSWRSKPSNEQND